MKTIKILKTICSATLLSTLLQSAAFGQQPSLHERCQEEENVIFNEISQSLENSDLVNYRIRQTELTQASVRHLETSRVRRQFEILRNSAAPRAARLRAHDAIISYIARLPLNNRNPFFQWECPDGFRKNREARITVNRTTLPILDYYSNETINILNSESRIFCINDEGVGTKPSVIFSSSFFSLYPNNTISSAAVTNIPRTVTIARNGQRIRFNGVFLYGTEDLNSHAINLSTSNILNLDEPVTLENHRQVPLHSVINPLLSAECQNYRTHTSSRTPAPTDDTPSHRRSGGPGGGNGGVLEIPEAFAELFQPQAGDSAL